MVTTQLVSPNYFSALGIKPFAGRLLESTDANVSASVPVVLSNQFWAAEFNRARAIIGRTIRVRNYPFLVIGVLPEGFHDIDVERAPDLRFPISAAPLLTGNTVREPGGDNLIQFQILVRLAKGVPPQRAAEFIMPKLQEMEDSLWHDWYVRSTRTWGISELSDFLQWRKGYRVTLLNVSHGVSQLREQFSRAVLVLMGAVGLLLFAVCANVAGLLLAKCEERKREFAVRLAIGAGQVRLFRQLIVENMLLAIPGAVLGIAFSYLVSGFLLRLLPKPRGFVSYATPLLLQAKPDAFVLLFAVLLSIATVLVFGMLPAQYALRMNISEHLKGSSESTFGLNAHNMTSAVQAALAVILLAGAVVMTRTFWNLQHLDPSFDRAHVVEFTLDTENAGYKDKKLEALVRDLREEIKAIPGVRSVAFANHGVMRGVGMKTTVAPQGIVLPEKTFLNTNVNLVTESYFDTLGIPFLAGRNFYSHDVKQEPEAVVVNRAFAQFFFPDQNALGKAIVQGTNGLKPPTSIIVGIVGTAKYRSLREPDVPISYGLTSDANAGNVMYLRTYGNPAQIVRSVRNVLQRVAPTLLIADVLTLEQEIQNSLWQERLVTILCGFFGVAALILSIAGLYSVLAYSVVRRSRELGIRIAIGAQVRHIVQTVCLKLFVFVGCGLFVGLLGAALLLRVADHLVYGVSSRDPLSLAAAAILVLFCAGSAAIFPAWRAIRTNPRLTLKAE